MKARDKENKTIYNLRSIGLSKLKLILIVVKLPKNSTIYDQLGGGGRDSKISINTKTMRTDSVLVSKK